VTAFSFSREQAILAARAHSAFLLAQMVISGILIPYRTEDEFPGEIEGCSCSIEDTCPNNK
jgi:hypothetical protein